MGLTKEQVDALTITFPHGLDLKGTRDLIHHLCDAVSSPTVDIDGNYNFSYQKPGALSHFEEGISLKYFMLHRPEDNGWLIRLGLLKDYSTERDWEYTAMVDAELIRAPHMYGSLEFDSERELFERRSSLISRLRAATEQYFLRGSQQTKQE